MRDIEAIVRMLSSMCPTLSCEQLKVSHSRADDDGIWFFRNPPHCVEIQVESSDGNCPFLVESNTFAGSALTLDETVAIIAEELGLIEPGPN